MNKKGYIKYKTDDFISNSQSETPKYDRKNGNILEQQASKNPLYGKPSHDKPSHDKPSHDKPFHDKRSNDKPSHGKPLKHELSNSWDREQKGAR